MSLNNLSQLKTLRLLKIFRPRNVYSFEENKTMNDLQTILDLEVSEDL